MSSMAQEERQFVIGPGPHVRSADTTESILWTVNLSLLPAILWGGFVFGWHALGVVGACVLGALAAETLVPGPRGRMRTLKDGSAVCTGLLLGMTLPPLLAPWIALLGGAFGILLAKSLFGGLGFNLFNPALIGRAFLLASFPQAMTLGWAAPRAGFAAPLDAVTTPTPLAALKEHGLSAAIAAVHGTGAPWSNLVLGFRPGSIGEVSVALVALGAAYLVWRRILTLTIPLAVFAGLAASTAFTGALGLHLLTGGLWLGAFYMATDYVTSPTTRAGQIVFGLAIGVLTGLIRTFGGYPEGICYAILIANAIVPALNLWFRPRRVAPAEALS